MWRRVGVLTVADAMQDEPLLGQALEQATAVELGEPTEEVPVRELTVRVRP
jgi:hypothetical protein